MLTMCESLLCKKTPFESNRIHTLVPRIELPPLSPGIHERVIEEDVVLDTVSLGWSGGTR